MCISIQVMFYFYIYIYIFRKTYMYILYYQNIDNIDILMLLNITIKDF